MKIKNLLFTAIMAVSALTVSAQSAGDVRFGVTAGMNVANISDTEMDSRIGFHVGVKGEYNFSKGLYGSASLLFTQKGCKYEEGGASIKLTPGYLQLPINLGYRYNVSESVSVFGETGPYFAIGICGKEKYEYDRHNKKEDFFGDSDEGGANRFDFGWGVKAGVEAKGFQIGLGYEYGFTKVWKETSAHNGNFMVSVAYMF